MDLRMLEHGTDAADHAGRPQAYRADDDDVAGAPFRRCTGGDVVVAGLSQVCKSGAIVTDVACHEQPGAKAFSGRDDGVSRQRHARK